MIYAVSDLHGCYDRYRKLLDKLNLGEQDTLYVLGDALDRGPEGFRILSDMASRPQVVGLLGNHEAMALEIKKSANPDRREVKKYQVLDKTGLERGSGGIVCMCEEVIPIDEKNSFIPCNLL